MATNGWKISYSRQTVGGYQRIGDTQMKIIVQYGMLVVMSIFVIVFTVEAVVTLWKAIVKREDKH